MLRIVSSFRGCRRLALGASGCMNTAAPQRPKPVALPEIEIRTQFSSNPLPDYDATCQITASVALLAGGSHDPAGQSLVYEWSDMVDGVRTPDFYPASNPTRTSEAIFDTGLFTSVCTTSAHRHRAGWSQGPQDTARPGDFLRGMRQAGSLIAPSACQPPPTAAKVPRPRPTRRGTRAQRPRRACRASHDGPEAAVSADPRGSQARGPGPVLRRRVAGAPIFEVHPNAVSTRTAGSASS
jgi:hypothetical protein